MQEIYTAFIHQTTLFDKILIIGFFVLLVSLIVGRVREMRHEDFDGQDN